MIRVPEPDLMNASEQALAYAAADFSEPHEHFVDVYAQKFEAPPKNGFVLDLGCGPADVTLRFARRFRSCKVVGVDGADAMLRLGRAAIDKAELADRVSLRKAYLPASNIAEVTADVIISNSLLHHLRDPQALWQSVKENSHRGKTQSTQLFVMDLMRPDDDAQVKRLVDQYAGNEPDILRHDFAASLRAAYLPGEVREQLVKADLGTLRVDVISDRHFIVFGTV